MTGKNALLLICVAACGGEQTTVVVDDEPSGDSPKQFSYDVVVTNRDVAVYTGARDLSCGVREGGAKFPHFGECAGVSDVINSYCPGTELHSCITEIALEAGGVRVAAKAPAIAYATRIAIPQPAPADLALVIEGCGQMPALIALPTSGLPQPTITGVEDRSVEWTTDVPADSAVVTHNFYDGAELCHALASPFPFPNTGIQFGGELELQALLPPAYVSTPLGLATVWAGGTTTMHLP